MKTASVINKYRVIIGGILKVEPTEIKFFIKDRGDTVEEKAVEDEIGELVYKKDNNFSQGFYTVKHNGNIISTFKLYEMPHCCAYLISCNVNVRADYRNKRIGTVLNTLRQDIARLLGYSSLICTDIEDNQHQRRILATNGWKDVHTVINKRTNNKVYLSVINI